MKNTIKMSKFKKKKKLAIYEPKKKKNSVYKAPQSKIYLLIVLFLMLILSINFILSGIISYEKEYSKINNSYGTITIKDSLVNGGNKISETILLYNTDTCLINCVAKFKTVLYSKQTLMENPKFAKLIKNKYFVTQIKSNKVYIKTGQKEKIVEDWREICVVDTSMQNSSQLCSKQIVGIKIIYEPNYSLYDGNKLDAGTYYWELRGQKNPMDNLEWTVELQGIETTEWAAWNSTYELGLTDYFTMSDNTNSINASRNLTIGTTQITFNNTAIKGNSGFFNETNCMNISNSISNAVWNGSANQTISFWTKRISTGSSDIITKYKNDATYGLYIGTNGVNQMQLPDYASTGKIQTTEWSNVVVLFNGNGSEGVQPAGSYVYFNGTYDSGTTTVVNSRDDMVVTFNCYGGGGRYVGFIDEVARWDRVLNQYEINDLYNNGTGIFYGDNASTPSAFTITQNFPTNYYNLTNQLVTFNATFDMSLLNMTNFTFSVFNYTQFNITNATSQLNYTWQRTMGYGTNYSWNITACGRFNNGTYFCNSTANWFFNVNLFTINSQSYTKVSSELSSETFLINISYDNSATNILKGYLNYNGTDYLGTNIYDTNGNAVLSKTILLPAHPTTTVGNWTNYSFYWNIYFGNATVTLSKNATEQYQQVFKFGIDNCTIYNNSFINYYLKDEQTQNFIQGNIETNLQLFSLTNSLSINLTSKFVNVTNASLCSQFPINSSYKLSLQTKYYGTNTAYVSRYNYIDNLLVFNQSQFPQNITLYDLLSSPIATSFLITYKDKTYLSVAGAILNIQKKYIDENVYKTVEMAKTDDFGQATGYFDLNSGTIYSITATRNGVLLDSFNNIALYCQSGTACVISLNGAFPSLSIPDFTSTSNLRWTINVNQTTRNIYAIFSTIDNSIATVTLEVKKVDNYMNSTICTNSLTTSSGTLICNVPESYGNSTIMIFLYKDGSSLISQQSYSFIGEVNDYLQGNQVVIILVLMLTIPLMFLPTMIPTLIGALIGVSAGIYLLAISHSWLQGGFLIWIIVAAVIIIIKINKKGE